jgi:predicted alpha/beta hydrolase family esterase
MTVTSNPKPRVVYLHGDGVLYWSWGWVARLHEELRVAGFPTFFELFPDSIEARAKYWMPFLEERVRVSGRDVLLGWSCGAVAALRLAERQSVAGLALVAPYYTDLGLDIVRRAGWVDQPWDWARIRENAPRIAMFHSDNDPYVSQSEFADLADRLGAEVNVVPGAGHFGDQQTFPALAEYLTRTYA